ncbi:MAG: FG-GAP-like repeat-containing protein [Thermoanaerobaculia bacterium]
MSANLSSGFEKRVWRAAASSALLLVVAGGMAAVGAQTPGAASAAPAAPAAPPAATAAAPPAPAPEQRQAQGLIQANDFEGALKLLEPLVEREPKNARAWRMIGFAALRAKQFDKAIGAYQKSLVLEPAFDAARYNLGVGYALKGDRDRAFATLAEVKATRRVDMSQVEVDDDLEALRSDPRFKSILPAPGDFTDPFVEPVKILREWDGEGSNDQFGWIGRNIGDVDGDHVPDIVTSAPTHSLVAGKQDKAGRIYVYSTKSGKLLWTADGNAGDQLGTGIEGAGDTNADGVPDVIAGAPYASYAKVYSGRDGKLLLTLKGKANESFGLHTSGVGDVDGDGGSELLIGAPGATLTATPTATGAPPAPLPGDTGHAYLYSGKTGKLLIDWKGERDGDQFGATVGGAVTGKKILLIAGAGAGGPANTGRVYVYDAISPKPQFTIDADESGNALGSMFVAVPGDVDGDGVPDVFASDWSNTAKGRSTGRVYVHSGKDGHRLLTLTGETAGEGFGTSNSNAGDVDGDGHADLIVGAWQFAGGAVSGGRAQLFSGKDGSLMKSFTCKTMGDTFGFDAVTMGDVDGDGTDDFLITSGWSAIHGYRSGRMFLLSSGIAKKRAH